MNSDAQLLETFGYENVVVFDCPCYSEALIGVSNDNRAVYDYCKMIQSLMEQDEMTYEEAAEFIEFNVFPVLESCKSEMPIIIFPIGKGVQQ